MNKIKYSLLLFIGLFFVIPAQSQIDTSCINIQQINSASDEYLPFLVDSVLMFTSNRKNTQEGQTLEFSEKVYWSAKKKGTWSVARKNGYKWNSDNNTALIGVSSDYFFFYRSYWKDNGEIFRAKRKEDTINQWKAFHMEKLSSVCSDYDENSITTGKGDTIYFVSNRNGNYDIFMQTDKNNTVPLDSLNTLFDEQDVFLTSDSKSLFFSSNRPGGKGGYDIYVSNKVDKHWSKPKTIEYKEANTTEDDRDFRWYNDSTMFLSSNRKGGKGGFDIYLISILHKAAVKIKEDTVIVAVDTVIPEDTVETLVDINKEKNELEKKLEELGLVPFSGELQLGAYRFIPTLELFVKKFPCIKKQNMRMDVEIVEGKTLHKFIINKVYTDVDSALQKQLQIINLHCLPEDDFKDMPFIGMLNKENKRYAIFWKKDEFLDENIFYIFENGKQIWKGRRF
jgi:hypothetical protein